MPLLTGAKDEARQAAEAIRAIGPRAREPLAEQLERLVRAAAPNPALEKAVAELLGRLDPNFQGYDPAAAPEARLQHIAAWRQQNGRTDT